LAEANVDSLSLAEAGVAQAESAQTASAVGFASRLLRSLQYLWTTEVHAYAFSIAANALLSFFPFSLLLLTVCRSWLRWQGAYDMVVELLRVNLPTGADFVVRNLSAVMRVRRQTEVASVLLLFLTSSGVFLPLEVALNRIWGIRRNRSYLGNLAVSVMLAVLSGIMAFAAVAVGAIAALPLPSSTLHSPASGAMLVLSRALLESVSLPLMIGIYFLVYWVLPNGRIPAARAVRAALIAALTTEAVRWVFIWLLPFLHFPEVYGPFAISATLLIWSFLGSLILLWGASLFADGLLTARQHSHSEAGVAARVLNLEA
jgi:YihY family inner membrane protein